MKKKVQTKEEPSIQEYNEKKEEKELMVEKLKRKGIGVVFQNNTPMLSRRMILSWWKRACAHLAHSDTDIRKDRRLTCLFFTILQICCKP